MGALGTEGWGLQAGPPAALGSPLLGSTRRSGDMGFYLNELGLSFWIGGRGFSQVIGTGAGPATGPLPSTAHPAPGS